MPDRSLVDLDQQIITNAKYRRQTDQQIITNAKYRRQTDQQIITNAKYQTDPNHGRGGETLNKKLTFFAVQPPSKVCAETEISG